ncbi:MAG: hypothetical protein E7620_03305 [Ruminococcaceae bacterium]|nr:hypothetical protein [Oscillospiraceae bacterium]
MNLCLIDKDTAVLEREENETVLESFLQNDCECAMLTVPNGIETIAPEAFARFPCLEQVKLPKSVRELGTDLFKRAGNCRIRIDYAGTSEAFIAMAKPTVTQEYVSGAYDHYPYYSDYGSGYREVVYAFDLSCEDVEVFCAADETYLYYGKKNKNPADELPMTREAWLAREEAERNKKLAYTRRVFRFFEEAGTVYFACGSNESGIDLFPAFGTFALHEDKIYLATRSWKCVYPHLCRNKAVSVVAVCGDRWIRVTADGYAVTNEETLAALSEKLPMLKEEGYEVLYLDHWRMRPHKANGFPTWDWW